MAIYKEPLEDLQCDGVPDDILANVILYLFGLSEEEHSKIMLDDIKRLALTASNESPSPGVLIQGKDDTYIAFEGNNKATYSDNNNKKGTIIEFKSY